MSRYAGKLGVVYLSPDGSAAARKVTLSNWTLDMSADRHDVTSFEDANKVQVLGHRNTEGTLAGFWDDTDDIVFDAAEADDGTNLYLYPTRLVPGIYWYGPSWLDASIEVPVDGPIRITGNFSARGSWGRLGIA